MLATKVFARMGPGPNDIGASRGHILDGVARSLERLQTDYIDLYQIHQADIGTGVEETMRALNDLVSQRMIRYVGVSNWEAWRIMKANGIADRRGWAKIDTNQAYYSLAGRDLEQELVPLMGDQQIGCLVWSPLAGGYLAGKYTPLEEGGGEAQEPGRRACVRLPAPGQGQGGQDRDSHAAHCEGAWRFGGARRAGLGAAETFRHARPSSAPRRWSSSTTIWKR